MVKASRILLASALVIGGFVGLLYALHAYATRPDVVAARQEARQREWQDKLDRVITENTEEGTLYIDCLAVNSCEKALGQFRRQYADELDRWQVSGTRVGTSGTTLGFYRIDLRFEKTAAELAR
jgi:hypothetical protein